MDIIQKYGDLIKSVSDTHPGLARKMIAFGLDEEIARMSILPQKRLPKGMQKLNRFSVNKVRKALKDPERSCWTNIFAPVEIMQCFDLNCLSMECLASFMSGFRTEDYLINEAEASGIAPTMCSYHKSFIGGVDSGVLPKAKMAVTTSMVCDGNVMTFRHVEKKHGVPCFVLDIPYVYTKENEAYLAEQLRELISFLQEQTGRTFDMDRLRQVLERENLTRKYYRQFLSELKHRYYPKTLTLDMYFLFPTHLDIGTQETLDLFRYLRKDIRSYPERHGKSIFWVHLLPYYQETLKSYFNYREDYFIQAMDFNLDYMKELDTSHPLEALARKMIGNIYNGPYERKVKAIARMVREFEPDGVIHFCHWGCKQSSGGVMLLREEIRKLGVPVLILDGDALDRRNSHDGQIRTRLEAFLEMLDQQEGQEQKNED